MDALFTPHSDTSVSPSLISPFVPVNSTGIESPCHDDDENDDAELPCPPVGGYDGIPQTKEKNSSDILLQTPATPLKLPADTSVILPKALFPASAVHLAPILESNESQIDIPIVDELLDDAPTDLLSDSGDCEDVMESLQSDMLPYSDRPLPRRSTRVVRNPDRLHYYKAGSSKDVREANMTVSGLHIIPTGSMFNSCYPLSEPLLTDSSLLSSCFYSEAIPPDDVNNDSCIALTSENLTEDEVRLCFLSEVPSVLADPITLEEALSRSDGDKWRDAYQAEMDAIDHHETYTWESLPVVLGPTWYQIGDPQVLVTCMPVMDPW